MLALNRADRCGRVAVDIFFKTKRLARVLNSAALMKKHYGAKNAAYLKRRMAVLLAASSLADVPRVPPERCHRLKSAAYRGCFAVDGLHPHRLVFEPIGWSTKKGKARLNLHKITAITILEVVDYH